MKKEYKSKKKVWIERVKELEEKVKDDVERWDVEKIIKDVEYKEMVCSW